ncbi:MAG: hypothetical protein AB1806_12235 [Acidobacteriota bacterium]
MRFELVGAIEDAETIAVGPSLKVRAFLKRAYGPGRWRKRKGRATVRLPNGNLWRVELHWYEAHGIGRRDLKIKKFVDAP